MDNDVTTHYLTHKERYQQYNHAIYPKRVYAHPHIKLLAIVELPYTLQFQVERLLWDASKISQRPTMHKRGGVNIFAVMRSFGKTGKHFFDVMFINEQVLTIWQRWIRFEFKHENILKQYYQKHPIPHVTTLYEQRAINYHEGLIFGAHTHLFRVCV